MSGPTQTRTPDEPRSTRAEAAAWVARLQRPDRDPETEQAFRRWFESDAAHAAAFNRATEVWQAIGGAAAGMETRRFAIGPAAIAATLVVAVGAGGGAWLALRDPSYSTAVGEQRTIRLDDGTRVALNTDTRIVVDYSKGQRRVRLVRGEAQFDVAKNARRPFVVRADGQEVRALGTSFIVCDVGAGIAVTLLEGKVTVSPAPRMLDRSPTPSKPVVLKPGERLKVSAAAAAQVDRPRLETVTAWRSGQILLDNTPLSEAVAEMNRYSATPLELESDRIKSLRVSGIFGSGESEAFARSVAAQYDLALVEKPRRLVLSEPGEARQ